MSPKDAIIVGGGISGLAVAHRLKAAGRDILLLEKGKRLGGAVLTRKTSGFLIDCGPNSTLETSSEIHDFVDGLGLADERVYANSEAKKRYILKNGKLQALPASPPAFFASKLFSARAKFRLLAEPFIKPAPEENEETIAEFVERRLGREFLDYAINPFVAGVYAGDPKKLSVQSAVRKVYALERDYGSLIRGAIKGAKARKARGDVEKTKAQLFSFRGGMSVLTDRLAEKLGSIIQTNCEMTSVKPLADGGYEVSLRNGAKNVSLETAQIVFATPAHVTAAVLRAFNSNLSAALEEIDYPPVAVVFLGYESKPPGRDLDGFGFLVPEVEQRKILGTIWSSTIFPERAPNGGAALTTFVGGDRQPEIAEKEEAEIVEIVLTELKDILSFRKQPDVVHVHRWQKAIPQYKLGHGKRIAAVEDFEAAHPGLHIAGNFRDGVSLGDCVFNSKALAERCLARSRMLDHRN